MVASSNQSNKSSGIDLTVVAVPAYFVTMGLEYARLRRRAESTGAPKLSDYERRDTIASLTMGVWSLVAPLALPKLFRHVTPGKGRYAKQMLAVAAAAGVATTVADAVGRRARRRRAEQGTEEPQTPVEMVARQVSRVGGVTTIALTTVAISSAWASRTTVERLWKRRFVKDLGTGKAGRTAAILGWDFIYYWNHRFMHESRALWAVHVVHHSSERYNLSTALRQPVSDALGVFVPYAGLALVGVQPGLIAEARGINLLYQYWIHTDAIGKLGPAELVLNTPSHHRVHHGSNPQYLDKNYGSILIVWDRLFKTFEPEVEPVVYGLTKNINTFNPWKIADHEYRDIVRDIAGSTSWRERLSFLLFGPGWAYSHEP
ncbi:MAG TPA: sterol desaturase family protein, partial [Acidimicrobiales bacterium]|nr:sterol desaturase family protein [Acidimicrobiales bacterium]